jgi:CrcB protein
VGELGHGPAREGAGMSVPDWILVALVGGAAAVARYVLDSTLSARTDTPFPIGTFAVNISGALVLGLLNGLALTTEALLIAGTATIGSYTTFSTWMLETQRLVEDAEVPTAVANLVLSILAGVAAAALGRWIGGRL